MRCIHGVEEMNCQEEKTPRRLFHPEVSLPSERCACSYSKVFDNAPTLLLISASGKALPQNSLQVRLTLEKSWTLTGHFVSVARDPVLSK